MGDRPRYLLCPPDYFRVDYAINPWMGGTVDTLSAFKEWFALEDAIVRCGGDIEIIEAHPDLPDMVFAANAGCVKDNQIVVSNFKHVERRPEAEEYAKWFEDDLFTVHRLSETVRFEGCGDCEFIDNTLVGGYGFRSDLLALEMTAGLLGAADLVPLRLIDPRFYHLDTCFIYLGGPKRMALYYPPAFDPAGIAQLEKYCTLVPIGEYSAAQFVCNSIVIGNNVIMPENNSVVSDKIRDVGFSVTQVAAREFMKAGGSLRCLSLDLTK